MAQLPWRVGAFADRFPDEARDIGRAHRLEADANSVLFDTAGGARPGAIEGLRYGPPMDYPCQPTGCCGPNPCAAVGLDTACSRRTCAGQAGEDEFEDTFPEVDAALDEAHALSAAIRDILTDPDVEDTAACIAQAVALAGKGKLSASYVPAVPAKKMPDGSDAPARCPICGALVCPSCGSSCECCDSAIEDSAE